MTSQDGSGYEEVIPDAVMIEALRERQTVPWVMYQDNKRIVLGTATVENGKITMEWAPDTPADIVEAMKIDVSTLSLSAAEVFDRDTPIFPANAYSYNEPLAEARLIDAILGVKEIVEIETTEERHDG